MEKVLLDPTQDPTIFRRAQMDKSYKPDWDAVFQNYKAAVDWPAAAFWEDIYKTYPEARVILTIRDPEDWYRSVGASIRDWPMSETEEWPQRMKDTRLMARSVVKQGALSNYADKQAMIAQFNAHIARVKETVPADRLLIMNLGEGWEPLCSFLKVPVPRGVRYPHANKGSNFAARMLAVRDVINSQSGHGDIEKAQAYRELTDLGSATQLILHI